MKAFTLPALAMTAALCTAGMAPLAPAVAADFPTRPIKLIVPYPPGGGADIFARTMAEALGDDLKQTVIVENKPGANGIIGTDAAAKSPPDGYTILLGNIGPNSINDALYPDLPYDSVKDFAAVSLIGYTTHVLAVNPKLPVKTVKELIDYAKKAPAPLNYASSGLGGSPHLAGELFALTTGTTLAHIPYKGAAPGNSDLIAGHVQLTFNTLPPLAGAIKAGQVRPLAVTSSTRTALFPDVPTMAEAGVPGYDVKTWYGIFAPAKTPEAAVNRLNEAFRKILASDKVRTKLEGQGYEVATSTPKELGDLVRDEVKKWKIVVEKANVKVQ
jgi:tripartite-type tricarboxylate transporter receptor subunit TctC